MTSTEWLVSERVLRIQKSTIHEMTRLSKEIDDVAFLSGVKPTSDTPEHVKQSAIQAINEGKVDGHSIYTNILELREEIVKLGEN